MSAKLTALAALATPAAADLIYVVDDVVGTATEKKVTLANLFDSVGIVADTSPQLGGALDTNANNIAFDDSTGIVDENGAEQLIFQTVGSAANYMEIVNSIATASPIFRAAGSDTNIGINLTPKGTGDVIINAGDLGATGSRVTKVWATDIESDNIPTVGGTGILTSLTAPQFTTIELGHASDSTLSRVSAGLVAVEGVNLASQSGINAAKESFVVAASDETTALTVADGKVTFRMPYAFTLTDIRASVTTAPTGAALTVDVTETGTTILSTLITIDATEKTSETAATPPVISDAALADDAEISVNVDVVGSSVAGAGLKVTLIGYQT